MTLFARGQRWELHCANSLFALAAFAASGLRADCLLTDPPYSSGGAFRGDRAADPRSKYLSGDSAQADVLPTFAGDTRDQRAHTLWLGEVAARGLSCLLPSAPALFFTDWRQLAATEDALQVGGLVLRGIVPWLKPDHACRPRKGAFRQSAEFVVWGSHGPWPVERAGVGCLPGHFTMAAPPQGARVHVTEKPVELLSALLAICTPGGIVLDPFAGSGSTGEAAIRTGRRAILVETSPEYCRIAARRLAEVEASL